MLALGSFWFGIVIGFITYRTLKHKKDAGISDIAAVISAVGGGAVLALFPVDSGRFDSYAIGLAIGFFAYLTLSLVITWRIGESAAKTFLGDDDR
jgi:hypothetical protein